MHIAVAGVRIELADVVRLGEVEVLDGGRVELGVFAVRVNAGMP